MKRKFPDHYTRKKSDLAMSAATLTLNTVSAPMLPLFAVQPAAQTQKAPKRRYDDIRATGQPFCIQEGVVVFLDRC